MPRKYCLQANFVKKKYKFVPVNSSSNGFVGYIKPVIDS